MCWAQIEPGASAPQHAAARSGREPGGASPLLPPPPAPAARQVPPRSAPHFRALGAVIQGQSSIQTWTGSAAITAAFWGPSVSHHVSHKWCCKRVTQRLCGASVLSGQHACLQPLSDVTTSMATAVRWKRCVACCLRRGCGTGPYTCFGHYASSRDTSPAFQHGHHQMPSPCRTGEDLMQQLEAGVAPPENAALLWRRSVYSRGVWALPVAASAPAATGEPRPAGSLFVRWFLPKLSVS